MARGPRVEVAEVPYHLVIRGNNREAIFLAEDCFIRYIELLRGYKIKLGYKLYCYCLMPNHIHLILEASKKAPISKIMQCINTSYTHYFNKRFKRTGHVLEGRYKSIIIEKNEYLLHLSRYIHMNPVRATLCKMVEDYKYSSAGYYLPGNKVDGLVDTDFILSALSDDVESAAKIYLAFLNDGYELYTEERV